MLNRVLSWGRDGIQYEADQRHADIVVDELGLKESKPVSTPGSKEDVDRMPLDLGEPLNPTHSTQYRALAARLNYLALDRPDIQFATKEAAKYMSAPSEGNWLLMKRIGRYLKGNPRLVQMFRWQSATRALHTYTDSDWAGDKVSRKSKRRHCIPRSALHQILVN